MNREIKYKGKRIDNGEWVYGYYVKLPHPLTAFLKDYIVISGFDDKRESSYQDFILVEPETVGQFTGLYDKNGVEIYEGDIVIQCIEVKNPRTHKSYKTPRFKERMGIVEFKDGCFDFKSENYSGQIRCYIGHDKNEIQIEVIGNIHDN